jgi:RNA polymerase sigma-70 factor (ECF subfamily)
METDEALYARVKRGDMRAFDDLYARYEARLFGFLLGQLKNRADAEDAFHEAFLNTLKSREVSFVEGAGFKTWLYRIARNLTLNRIRSSQRGARAYAQLEAPEPAAAADAAIEKRELLEALDLAVAQLPPALSELYHLRSSGLSYEEMAGVLEIPLGTLKSRMNQMMNVLREELRPWTAR